MAEVDIMYGQGISQEGELLDMAVEKDLISKSGAWYGYKEERIGQGRENAKQYMADHPEMMAEVSNWSVMHTASVTVKNHYRRSRRSGEKLPLDE